MAITLRPSVIMRDDPAAEVQALFEQDSLRTECVTPLAITLGLVMWAVIILVLRALL